MAIKKILATLDLLGASKVKGLLAGTEANDAVNLQQLNEAVSALGNNFEWQKSVLSIVTEVPATPAEGDRYLVGVGATGDFSGKDNQIAEFNGTTWDFTVVEKGTYVSVDDVADSIYYFGGATWTQKHFELTTAGAGLEKNGFEISITDAGVTTAKIAADAVTKEKIAEDVAGAGIAQNADGSLEVNVGDGLTIDTDKVEVLAEDDSIEVSALGIKVKADYKKLKYTANVGNGTDTDITVTHSIGTKDVLVQVYSNSTPWDTVEVYVDRPTDNTISLSFAEAPTTDEYRVVIIG